MKYNKGLIIPIHMLEMASGISKKIIINDIKESLLIENPKGYVWYSDALRYVHIKWRDGNTEMYPPYGDEPGRSFASRILSMMDDEIAVDNLNLEWKD